MSTSKYEKMAALKIFIFGVLLILFALSLSGCGNGQGYVVFYGNPCTVTKVGTLSTVTCPDGSTVTVSDGAVGAQGLGAGLQVTVSSSCPFGVGGIDIKTFLDPNNTGTFQVGDTVTSLSTICNGSKGDAGNNGTNGTNGINGNSFEISQVAATVGECPNGGIEYTTKELDGNGNVIPASVVQSAICNGTNGGSGQAGTDGTNGTNGGTVTFSLVQAIEPCTAASSPWKEVILGLQGGQLLSSFSQNASGQDTRFSFIPNGSYQDTDSSGCTFTVTGNGSTTSQISWGAGSNAYATWPAGGFSWTPSTGWVAL